MLKKIILLLFITFFFLLASAKKRSRSNKTSGYTFQYPELYRDHVFHTLSEKGKEMFYAVDIHPSCLAKGGQCIPRAKCVGKDMLYISRICYKRDLVCCYDNTIRFPLVGGKDQATSTTTTEESNATTTSLF